MNSWYGGQVVLKQAQLKILSHLEKFSSDLEESWDVPRGLCLPGISEAVGVVRSAVHTPLNELEKAGYVFSRNAHVTNAGSRRRKVVHITYSGRELISKLEIVPGKGRNFGPIPELGLIYGRDKLSNQIFDLLVKGNSIIISGLAGIGKTSVARLISELLMKDGWTVRWSTCNLDSDPHEIAKMWIGKSAPTDSRAIASLFNPSKNILVIDEIQEVSKRHISSIHQLISICNEFGIATLLIVRAPNPLPTLENFQEFRVDGISPPDSIPILSPDLTEERALRISESLGGHPLALHLWSPEDKLPEKGEAVQEFVENNVLKSLSSTAKQSLDELSISPLPLYIQEISNEDGIVELDDSAILRWKSSQFEPHHLIKNVRNAQLVEHQIRSLHSMQVKKWSEIKGERARRMEVFHSLKSSTPSEEWLVENISLVFKSNSTSAAILVEEALAEVDSEKLRELAAEIALERGEVDIAKKHIDFLASGSMKDLLFSRIYRIQGDSETANKLEKDAIPSLNYSDRVRAEISSLVREFDDHLPGNIGKSIAMEIIDKCEKVNISDLDSTDQGNATLSLELLKHSAALRNNNLALASKCRGKIEKYLGKDSYRLEILDFQSRLSVRGANIQVFDAVEEVQKLINKIPNTLEKIKLIHLTLEACKSEFPDWLIEVHQNTTPTSLSEDKSAHRRLIAQWWYWKGILNPTNKLSHWREAISRFKLAECNNAATNLVQLLSKSL